MKSRFLALAGSALVSSLGVLAPSAIAADSPGYHVARKVEVGGDGGWDYLIFDSAGRRLYVSRATRVQVFDADSFASVGEIPNTSGVHGIALAPELSRGFTSN